MPNWISWKKGEKVGQWFETSFQDVIVVSDRLQTWISSFQSSRLTSSKEWAWLRFHLIWRERERGKLDTLGNSTKLRDYRDSRLEKRSSPWFLWSKVVIFNELFHHPSITMISEWVSDWVAHWLTDWLTDRPAKWAWVGNVWKWICEYSYVNAAPLRWRCVVWCAKWRPGPASDWHFSLPTSVCTFPSIGYHLDDWKRLLIRSGGAPITHFDLTHMSWIWTREI